MTNSASRFKATNNRANESISKFKLLSGYGGPGSILHTQYGSIIISSIDEWGFLKVVKELHDEAVSMGKDFDDQQTYVRQQAMLGRHGSIGISNDQRLLNSLIDRKELINLKYLVLIPNIELRDWDNTVKEQVKLTIPSTFMPKVFRDDQKNYREYKEWYKDWVSDSNIDDQYGKRFFPPMKIVNSDKPWYSKLIQDNIVLICDHGHISDFPWANFLHWKSQNPHGIEKKEIADLFGMDPCCGTANKPLSKIRITSSRANASGFDGKRIKCMRCGRSTSLEGLMSLKVKCHAHMPWVADTGESEYHSGNSTIREKQPQIQTGGCNSNKPMKVALTTGNNLYFSRILSSIYLPDELRLSKIDLEIKQLELEKEKAKKEDRLEDAIQIQNKIKDLNSQNDEVVTIDLTESEKEVQYRFQEYTALNDREESQINIEPDHLKVKDVTENLDAEEARLFSKILRIDNMKVSKAQLDFSRVTPADSDSPGTTSQNIFKQAPAEVEVYPVVENYGEGIFFTIDNETVLTYSQSTEGQNQIENLESKISSLRSDSFSQHSISYAQNMGWQLYLIHTFSHLIMRELEFRCGYPTASLSERIYLSIEEETRMLGCLIYTTEGAEGSMGGLIAQTSSQNLNALIRSAIQRATICQSDPLCWESEGQGLFELNFASCFSCSLVSETSCEFGNMYLDRKILADQNSGFFKSLIS